MIKKPFYLNIYLMFGQSHYKSLLCDMLFRAVNFKRNLDAELTKHNIKKNNEKGIDIRIDRFKCR